MTSGNRRWTRTLPIGPPRSTSRKVVLFIARPWYQRCCRHNWHGTLWHALLSWPWKMSLLLLKKYNNHNKITWWAHNPQFHRIKTWLSCTPSCFQSYSSRVDSYVIHEPPSDEIINSGIRHNNYPWLWNHFHLLSRHWTIAWLLETSYCTFQLHSWCVLFVQLERYSYAPSWINPRSLTL